ncbi:MAG: T9SS type A sorting domain-containing protein, partial [Chitinophagaceae bacterium]
LKQIDKDGKFARSSVVLLQNTTNVQQLILFGNVVKTALNAQVEANKNMTSTIAVVDMSGRVLRTIQKQLQKGSNQVSINVDGLQAGNYQLQVLSGEGRISARFVVAK